MILADKIIELRKKNGWSQEELAEQLDVSRQAVSKWESAQAIPDMVRIVRMSELFGVSTDYLLKDDAERAEPAADVDYPDSFVRTVTLQEANAFLDTRLYNAGRVAIGVMLCILSPILLIYLSGAMDLGRLPLSEMQAVGIGLVVLLALVGAAVAIFITSGLRSSRYEYLEKEPIDTLYGVDGMVRSRRDEFQPTYGRQLTIGVVLCVISALPIFFALFINGEDEYLQIVAVCALLALVAIGVLLIVRSGLIWDSFKILLEEGDYTREAKEDRKAHANLNGIYWAFVTAAFLGYSFITEDWERSWIIWPVAGVAYAAVFGIAKALRQKKG